MEIGTWPEMVNNSYCCITGRYIPTTAPIIIAKPVPLWKKLLDSTRHIRAYLRPPILSGEPQPILLVT